MASHFDGLTNRDEAWKHYLVHVDIYKHHLDLILRFNIFYYGITGAIVSFYISETLSELVLIFPALISLAAAAFCLHALKLVGRMEEELVQTRTAIGMPRAPQFGALKAGLTISAVLFVIVGVSLCMLFFGVPLPNLYQT